MREQPKGTRLLILYNLNTNLDIPRTAQEDVLAAEMTDLGLSCSTRDYVSSTTQYVRGRRTFSRPTYTPEGERRWARGKPDYALMRRKDRRG